MASGTSRFTAIGGLGLCLTVWICVPAAAVSAEPIWSWQGVDYAITVSEPVAVGRGPLWSVILTVEGEGGVIPNTFDSLKSGEGGTGITTEGNQLHQIWAFNAFSTPLQTLESGEPIPQQHLDTHFLVDDDDDLVSFQSPSENRAVLDEFEDERAGYGSFLTGTFSVRMRTDETWPLARIVVPADTEVFLDFEIGAPGQPSETVGGSFLVEPQDPNPPGDLDFNGRVDRGDAARLIRNLGIAEGAKAFQGDLDGNQAVTLNDLLELQLSLGTVRDEVIPVENYFGGHREYGARGSYQNPVPEPSSICLFAAGALGLLLHPRRGRRRCRIRSLRRPAD